MSLLEDDDAERLAALRAAGLFEDLDDEERLEELVMNAPSHDDGPLAAIIEELLRNETREKVLQAPQTVRALVDAAGREVLAVIRDDPGLFIQLRKPKLHLYDPKTYHEYVAVFNRALLIMRDKRRFVAMPVSDPEEPLYLLVTAPQKKALEEVELLAWDNDEIEMPDEMSIEDRVARFGDAFEELGVKSRVAGDSIELDLDVARANALTSKLYEAAVKHTKRREEVNACEYPKPTPFVPASDVTAALDAIASYTDAARDEMALVREGVVQVSVLAAAQIVERLRR